MPSESRSFLCRSLRYATPARMLSCGSDTCRCSARERSKHFGVCLASLAFPPLSCPEACNRFSSHIRRRARRISIGSCRALIQSAAVATNRLDASSMKGCPRAISLAPAHPRLRRNPALASVVRIRGAVRATPAASKIALAVFRPRRGCAAGLQRAGCLDP